MNQVTDFSLQLPDALLQDIAKRVQLSPTEYRIASERGQTVHDYLNREGSPLRPYLVRTYPQGSMAIGATIASKLKNDEFDIDLIVELNIKQDSAPGLVLETLYRALNGEPGSRYHGKVIRRSRCVTLEYDNMHLDLTPACLIPSALERTSVIYHANENEPPSDHLWIVANPWGFASWFNNMMPAWFLAMDAAMRKVAEPLPDQEELNNKSIPLIALQLLKRWRNKCYDRREGRCPPSIVLAFFVASAAGRRTSLTTELLFQASNLLAIFENHDRSGRLITVVNPQCDRDVFTDRWPANAGEQSVFTRDLRHLVAQLDKLKSGVSVPVAAGILSDLFGENPTTQVVENFAKRYSAQAHNAGLHVAARTGAVALRESGISRVAPAVATYPIVRHTNFGSEPERE